MKNYKQLDEHRKHFIERLKERYDIDITEKQYNELCNLKTSKYKGILSKSSNSTIGIAKIKNQEVWVLYNSKTKCFSTCYPSDIETNIESAFRASFGSVVRRIAKVIFDAYLLEKENLPTFEEIKDAALYYFNNTMFPQLHIESFKHGSVSNMKIMQQINRILNNSHPHVKIDVRKKTAEEVLNFYNDDK